MKVKLVEPMRVLIVEDLSEYQESGKEIVSHCIQDPQIEYAADYESALPLLLRSYFDIVLLDLILHDGEPGPQETWEGPWLLQHLMESGLNPYVPIIIFTKDQDKNRVRELFRNFHVADLWYKVDPLENLVAALGHALKDRNYFGLACEVEFRGQSSWEEMAASLNMSRGLTAPISPEEANLELRHLVRKVFSDKGKIIIASLGDENERGNSGASVKVVTPFSAEGNRQTEVILKFGPISQISEERDRWAKLKNYMQSLRITQLERVELGRQLGALAYSLVGAAGDGSRITSFGRFYAGAGIDQIKLVVRTLFEENFGLCYNPQNRSEIKRHHLSELYSAYLNINAASLGQTFIFKFPDKPLALENIQFSGIARRFSHPVAAFCKGEADFTMETWMCLTHGDLHTGNILVDTDLKQPWLIDFGRAGLGHWARDLVALEASIKFQHVPAADLNALLELEAALTRPNTFAERIEYSRDDQPDLCKAAEVIKELRRIAGAIDARPIAMMDYYAALFYQTINYFRLHRLIKNHIRKNQVLLSTALLYEKLSGSWARSLGAG